MKAILIKIITSLSLTILTILLLMLVSVGHSELQQSYWHRIFIAFILGGLFSLLVINIWETHSFISAAISRIRKLKSFTILGSFLSIIILLYPNLFEILSPNGLDNLYDKRNRIDVHEMLSDSLASDFTVIFALDKTSYKNTPLASKRTQRDAYVRYINNIKKEYNDIPHVPYNALKSKLSYTEFCKAKLCSDLISMVGLQGKFQVLLLSGDTKRLFNTPKPFEIETIRNAIIQIFSEDYSSKSNNETDFDDFYEIIISLTGEDRTLNKCQFNKYALFFYSDFIHDKSNKSNLEDEVNRIIDNQKRLLDRCLVQNIYVIPYQENDNSFRKKYVLIDTIISTYFNVKELTHSSSHSIEETGNWILKVKHFSQRFFCNEGSIYSPLLLTKEGKKSSIRLAEDTKVFEQIKLKANNLSYSLNKEKFLIPSTTSEIHVSSDLETSNLDFHIELSDNLGIHGILHIVLLKTPAKALKFIIPIFFFIFGMFLCLVFVPLKRYNSH